MDIKINLQPKIAGIKENRQMKLFKLNMNKKNAS